VAEEKIPRSKEQTLETLRSSGEKWAGWLEGLTESLLGGRVQMRAGMMPASKSRFEMIVALENLEMSERDPLILLS